MIEAIAMFGWTCIVVFALALLWALKETSDIKNRETHHDGRKGSFYEISNRRDK
tara:strand:- start:262 stop:423 length:162 start_codon:yes stop_codon:yes gene_type:complete